jgi:hypothetical protein
VDRLGLSDAGSGDEQEPQWVAGQQFGGDVAERDDLVGAVDVQPAAKDIEAIGKDVPGAHAT